MWSTDICVYPVQGRLDAINVDKAVEYVISCMNFDGGFGCRPCSESHSGQVNAAYNEWIQNIHLYQISLLQSFTFFYSEFYQNCITQII